MCDVYTTYFRDIQMLHFFFGHALYENFRSLVDAVAHFEHGALIR
jgi:hypothetical protein